MCGESQEVQRQKQKHQECLPLSCHVASCVSPGRSATGGWSVVPSLLSDLLNQRMGLTIQNSQNSLPLAVRPQCLQWRAALSSWGMLDQGSGYIRLSRTQCKGRGEGTHILCGQRWWREQSAIEQFRGIRPIQGIGFIQGVEGPRVSHVI